jgi:predicted dehydrogenase
MADPVSVGVIGCGSVVQHAYMPLLTNEIARGKALPPKVCDVRADRIAEVEQQFRTSGSTQDPAELIADDSLDLILVLTSMPEPATWPSRPCGPAGTCWSRSRCRPTSTRPPA